LFVGIEPTFAPDDRKTSLLTFDML